ncbi:MAG: hypothetical protein ACRDTC_07650 [Pseudonocardiaceae bacterium]
MSKLCAGEGLPELRFVCDQDLDTAVASLLRKLGYEAWTVASAGWGDVADDDLR